MNCSELKVAFFPVWNFGKIRPDPVIKKVIPYVHKNIPAAEESNGSPGFCNSHIVKEKRHSLDMIKMCVGQEYMGYFRLCAAVQGLPYCSSVKEYCSINEKGGQIVSWEFRTRYSKDSYLHVFI